MTESSPEQPLASNNADLTRGRPFQKGNKAARGRAAGSRNKASVLLDRLADAEAEAIQKQVIEAAKSGDLRAAELILARIWPPRRGRPVRIDLPPVQTADGVSEALAALTDAMACGEVTPDEAATITAVLEARRKTLETVEHADRLDRIEQAVLKMGQRLNLERP